MRTPPGELARVSVVLTADICVTESAQVVVYLTTDVPRTRSYSVNHTYTPHVRFRLLFLRLRGSLTNTLGDAICNTNQGTRRALLYYGSITVVVGGDYTGFEAAHIFPLSETDIVGFVRLCSC
jgi:hypothetical protein